MKLEIYTDGACSGNPGPAAIGIVIKQQDAIVKEWGKFIGEATNNIAEYTAVVYALQEAHMLRADHISLFLDSELVCKQLTGTYKVSQKHLILLFDQIQHLKSGFQSFKVQHIRREQNKATDRLARQAIKTEQAKMVASQRAKKSS